MTRLYSTVQVRVPGILILIGITKLNAMKKVWENVAENQSPNTISSISLS
jgi:hypothetical protein